MQSPLYFTGIEQNQIISFIKVLAQGKRGNPPHVDVHTQNRCNATQCKKDCIGKSGRGNGQLEQKIDQTNIGSIIDKIITNEETKEEAPSIHLAGFTGDTFLNCSQLSHSLDPKITNAAMEAICHLQEKGLAEKVSLVTNGIGFSVNTLPFGKTSQPAYWTTLEDLLSYIGSVQFNLNATYGSPAFEKVVNYITKLNVHRERISNQKVYVKDPSGEELVFDLSRKSPLRIVGNYFLNQENCLTFPNLLERLNQERFREKYVAGGWVKMSEEGPSYLHRFKNSLDPDEDRSAYKYVRGWTKELIDPWPIDELRLRIDLFQKDNLVFLEEMMALIKKLEIQYADSGLKIILKTPPDSTQLNSIKNCLAPYFWPAVGPDGRVYPCAHTVIPGFAIGSLWDQTLDEILDQYYLKNWGTVPACEHLCPSTDGNINLLGKELLQ